MIIDKTKWGTQEYHFGLYNGCIAYDLYSNANFKAAILVFTGISPKRIKFKWGKQIISRGTKKVIYINNKQLLDINFMPELAYYFEYPRTIISDGKLGTKYDSKGVAVSVSNGSYFYCLRLGAILTVKI